ncbi:MAG: nucleotide sugar dehydrogenase, partial [Candidatus Binatia bacterium]
MSENDRFHVVIVGGCGHVGLPVGLAFASRGLSVVAYDTNLEAVDTVNAGKMPFIERGAQEVLHRVLEDGTFRASADPSTVRGAEYV